MATQIGQASILLTADTANFETNMANARDTANDTFGDIRQQAADMQQQFAKGFAVATAAVGALSATVGVLVKDQMELVSALGRTAQLANTTAAEIQKYTFAAKAMGVEQDKLGDIFKDTQDKVGDFLTTEGGELKDFFDNIAPRVGVTTEKLREMSGPDALQAIYNGLEKANVGQSEMVFYMESIADEASLLIPLLKNGGEGFKIWEEAAKNAGAVMDEKTIKATQELNASTKLLELTYQGAKNQFTQAVIPALSDMSGKLVGTSTAADTARVAGEKFVGGLKILAKVGVGVGSVFQAVGEAIGGFSAGVATFFSALDTKDPLSFIMSLGKANTAAAHVFDDMMGNIDKRLQSAANFMDGLDKLGTGATNATVAKVMNIANEQEAIKNLGITGAEQAQAREAAKEAAKEKEKAKKEQEKSAKASVKSNPFVSNAQLSGLLIKSKEATAGGQVRQATAEFARVTQDLLGNNLKYFSAFNDRYHKGRVSDHNTGMAFDIVLKKAKQSQVVTQQLQATAKQLGYSIKVFNEYVKPSKHSTGGHIHVSVKGYTGDRSSAKQAKTGYILATEQKAWQKVLANAQKYEFAKYEKMYGLPSGMMTAVHMKESAGDPNATSPVGAQGGFQIMPNTAKYLGLKPKESYDMSKATPAAAKYLGELYDKFQGNIEKTLAAYNAGPGNVTKYNGIPPFKETQDYVKKVKRYIAATNGGNEVKDLTVNQWLQDSLKAEEELTRQLQKEADARLAIQKHYADEKTKAQTELAAREQDIKNAKFSPEDEVKYLQLAQAEYQNKVNLIDLAHDKQMYAVTEHQQTDEERIINTAKLERRTVELTVGMAEDVRTASIQAINQKEMLALSALHLARDKAWQEVNEQYQTEEERIKARADLERREIMAIVKMDEALRTAKIKAVTNRELRAIQDLKDDYQNELTAINDYQLTELQRLRNSHANQHLAIFRDTRYDANQKQELADALAAKQEYEINELHKKANQEKSAFYAELSGVGELHSIETQHQARLDMIEGFLDNEVMTVEEAEKAKRLIRMQYAQDMLGSLANNSKAAFGEQSRAYQVMFAMQKGVAITQASLALWQNVSQAMAKGFPANVPLIAQAMAQGMGIIANIKSIKNTVVGQAHDGIMSVPKSGTWNLEKGERVLPKHTAQNLDNTLNRLQNNDGGQIINVNVTVNSDGGDVQSSHDLGKNLGNAIKLAVQAELQKERRQGGMLYGR